MERTGDCETAREMLGMELNTDRARGIIKLNRTDARNVVGVLCGHAPLNAHLFKIGKSDTEMCSLCEEAREDTMHVLCECPRSMIRRKRWLDEEVLSTREVKKLYVDKIAKFLGEVNPWKITPRVHLSRKGRTYTLCRADGGPRTRGADDGNRTSAKSVTETRE